MKRKLVTIGFVLTLIWGILIGFPSIASANHLPVMYVQVPQWADDWAVCAVDIPDAKCHWYVMAPDNTFGEGFDWEEAPWFDATGLNDVAPMQKETVVQKFKTNNGSLGCCYYGCNTCRSSDLVHLLYTKDVIYGDERWER